MLCWSSSIGQLDQDRLNIRGIKAKRVIIVPKEAVGSAKVHYSRRIRRYQSFAHAKQKTTNLGHRDIYTNSPLNCEGTCIYIHEELLPS